MNIPISNPSGPAIAGVIVLIALPFAYPWIFVAIAVLIMLPLVMWLASWLLGLRYIPHSSVGIIEKFWSNRGSLKEGNIVASKGEAGFQTRLLRGGLHWGFFPWQYKVHRQPLVTVSEGMIGYVYARDGRPLAPIQTLGQVVECNHFQDAQAFLQNGGQRGRQRLVLREGVYAINLALFVVITEDTVYSGPIREREQTKYADWQNQLEVARAFDPVVIGYGSRVERTAGSARDEATISRQDDMELLPSDNIGVVSVQDGPTVPAGEIIAPELALREDGLDHNYFQDPEAFLELGGKRGKQLQVLTDGTFFINRWFATVEVKPKTVIPIGYVGVVVSYYGSAGTDVTGDAFRYGEQVDPGHRGVWKQALTPGKYALNPYAVKVEMVPTVNFVLRWITGQVESHHYDEDLLSLELVTADGYEPMLPLSLILHIDYQKAPRVVQRFGDVRRLISQTLDPILTAYFRDVAQGSHMLDLLTKREEIQQKATAELGRRFLSYDIECVAVLIGRPEAKIDKARPDYNPIELLFDQLRARRLAEEQKETYSKQEAAAVRLKELNQANAAAEKQKELTDTRIAIEVAANRGEAQLAEAQGLAKRDIARAEGESRSKELLGKGEAARIAQIGLSEAAVQLQKIRAYGDPRLFALNLVSEQFASSTQPLVPERLLVMGEGRTGGETPGAGTGAQNGMLGQLIALLLSEHSGINVAENQPGLEELEKFTRQMVEKREAAPASAVE
jgi:uncharacterized membrane protein YqiK